MSADQIEAVLQLARTQAVTGPAGEGETEVPSTQTPANGWTPICYVLGMKGLCLLILPLASPRDVVMPGFHKVQHEVVFVQNDLLAEHRLVVTPLNGFAGFQEVVAGEPIPYSHKYGTKVYAVPADLDLSSAAPAQAREVFKDAAWPWTYVETGGQSVAPNASRIYRWRTTVRLASVSPEKIQLEVLERQGQTQDGRPVSRRETTVIASLLVAAGAAGLVWLRRRRERRAAPADE